MSILAVINPIAGTSKKENLINSLKKEFQNIDFLIWKNKNQDITTEIKNLIEKNNYSTIIACGGDGTINKVSHAILNMDINLGIIPIGSGNGFAHYLKIPININKAINIIKAGKREKIDVGLINNDYIFLCTFGIGFDAIIAHEFAKSKKRGVLTYAQKVIKKLFTYKPEPYLIEFNNQKIKGNFFLINIANINQWGFNIKIAPKALINDGFLDLTIVYSFNKIITPYLLTLLFLEKIYKSSKVYSCKTKYFKIFSNKINYCHFDGEAIQINGDIEIKILERSLNVIIP